MKYKVWVSIETADDASGIYEEVGLPILAGSFDNPQDADDWVHAATGVSPEVREASPALLQRVAVDHDVLKRLNYMLSKGERVRRHGDTLYSVTVKFADGFFADIKLCNGTPPFVDAVLFDEDGMQRVVLPPDMESFDGRYVWKFAERRYVARVECA
jgi:hypothetical protein